MDLAITFYVCYSKVGENRLNVETFFEKLSENQVELWNFLWVANFNELWKVISQASLNETFWIFLVYVETLQIH